MGVLGWPSILLRTLGREAILSPQRDRLYAVRSIRTTVYAFNEELKYTYSPWMRSAGTYRHIGLSVYWCLAAGSESGKGPRLRTVQRHRFAVAGLV